MQNNKQRICRERNTTIGVALARARAQKLCSISEYIYLSIIFEHSLPDISAVFSRIAERELYHHRLLGSLILGFGCDPAERVAVRCRGKIDLSEDAESRAPVAASRVLGENICSKKASEERFLSLASLCESFGELDAAEMLRQIADDERAHALAQSSLLA